MSSGSLPFVTYHRANHVGDGSFGSVVVVYNDDGEQYALKLFLSDDDDDNDEEETEKPIELGALREISCLRLLREENKHENIIELHDIQTDWSDEEGGVGAGTSGCLSIALPYMKSGSLADAIERKTFQGYPKSVKVKIAYGILSAVSFLHDQGIIHRDLKSDNILIEHDDETNELKPILIDFSLAKVINGTIWGHKSTDISSNLEYVAHTGEIGTVVYTAPEIVDKEPYGTPSDMYSVGIILLELLQNNIFTAEKHSQGYIQVETALNSLPESAPFPDLIRLLLSKDPAKRPTAKQALEHTLFSKFGICPDNSPNNNTHIIDIASALSYDDNDFDNNSNAEENEPPNRSTGKTKKTPSKNNQIQRKLQNRLKLIDKFLSELDSIHPWTRIAALEYSQQYAQLDDDIDNITSTQSLADCCILAYRFFELETLDLDDLNDCTTGMFANWQLDSYVDNEASIFMLLDYCLYPRKISI